MSAKFITTIGTVIQQIQQALTHSQLTYALSPQVLHVYQGEFPIANVAANVFLKLFPATFEAFSECYILLLADDPASMEFLKAPVTALEFCDKYLVSGVGRYLKIYRVNIEEDCKSNCDLSVKIFKQSVIHRIKKVKNSSKLLVFGGREWSLCSISSTNKEDGLSLDVEYSSFCPDWICDACILYPTAVEDQSSWQPVEVAFALAHNSVVVFDLKSKLVIREIHCEEKCILYSAHFLEHEWPTWQSLILCSGTVFNQVVIWSPGQADGGPVATVQERIKAHDGVIFDMHYHFGSKLFVTASDDRSIRIWRSSFLNDPTSCNSSPTRNAEECLCKLYGHESRVWRARLVQIGDLLYLVSVGEDGYCIIWKITNVPGGEKKLGAKIVKRMKCHKGRNIWSMALENHSGFLATGGGDGGIRIWSLKHLISGSANITSHPLDQNDDGLYTITQDLGSLKSIHLCPSDCVVAHTNTGALLHFSMVTRKWSLINFDENFKSYAVLAVCDDFRFVALGNTQGKISISQLNESWTEVVKNVSIQAFATEGKVHNISWCVHDGTSYLFASGPNGEFNCFKVAMKMKEDINNCHPGASDSIFKMGALLCQKRHAWVLPMAKHRWHMGVTMITCDATVHAVCGDRRGSLHLFKQGVPEPLHTLHGIHGKNGVTSLRSFGDTVLSTGRDGSWRKIRVNFVTSKIEVLTQNRAAQGMDWLEDIISIDKHDMMNTILIGFHGRNFSAWSSTTGDTLLSVECGGGHRDWSLKIQKDTYGKERSVLAFLKASTLHLAQVPFNILKEKSVIEKSYHGRQITCVRWIETYWDDSTGGQVTFLATGSEDTKLLISAYTHATAKQSAQLHKVSTMDDHISSIRALAAIRLADTEDVSSVLLFSGGGRASINCYFVKITKKRHWKQSCEVQHITSHSLNAESARKHNKASMDMDPEMRYMDLTAWNSGALRYVAAACSDATIRLFAVDVQKRNMKLIGTSEHSHCFLTISHIQICNHIYLISGATDGNILVWRLDNTAAPENLPAPCFKTQVHMSGINALCVLEMNLNTSLRDGANSRNKQIAIATGGDDNAIHVTILNLCSNADGEQLTIVGRASNPSAHATQITGLRCLRHKDGGVQLVSTSIDQRLTQWRLSLTQTELKVDGELHFHSSVLSDIADVSSMEMWEGSDEAGTCVKYWALCGQGLQEFKLARNRENLLKNYESTDCF